jgi:hypothetical protein
METGGDEDGPADPHSLSQEAADERPEQERHTD